MKYQTNFYNIEIERVKNIITVLSYNELEALPSLITNLSEKLSAEDLILIIDDSEFSTSVTIEKLVRSAFHNSSGQIVFISTGTKNGRGGSVRLGMELINSHIPDYKYFIECDSDESHQVENILDLIKDERDCDLLIGSRYLKNSLIVNWPAQRLIFSKLLNSFIPLLFGIKIKDITNGLRRYSKRSVQLLLSHKQINKGFTYLAEQAYILKLNEYIICETPTTFINRKYGKSTVGIKEIYLSIKGVAVLCLNKGKFKR